MPSFAPAARGALTALLAATAACSSTSDVTGTATPVAFLRVVDAVSDATANIDFLINGTAAVTGGLAFGTLFPPAGGYPRIPVGAQVAFAPAGGTPFYSQTPTLTANAPYTLIAYGRTASGATPTATAALLADTIVSNGSPVLVRAFNALDYLTSAGSVGGTPVDVYVYPAGAARPATASIPALGFGARSAYVTGTAGTLQVDVFAAGAASTGAPLFSAQVPTTAGSTAAVGSIRTLVLIDPPAAASTAAPGSVLVLNDAS